MAGNYQHAFYDIKSISAGLYLVENSPSALQSDAGWLRMQATDTVQNAITGGGGRVTDCCIGPTHSLVTVDNSEGKLVIKSTCRLNIHL